MQACRVCVCVYREINHDCLCSIDILNGVFLVVCPHNASIYICIYLADVAVVCVCVSENHTRAPQVVSARPEKPTLFASEPRVFEILGFQHIAYV